jgi:oleate hydratase
MANYHLQRKSKRSAENTEAWIFGSGTESLASALYLIRHAKLQPSKIHIIDKHVFSEKLWPPADGSPDGYDQFAACLPVSAGLPMRRLLAMIPSAQWGQGQSLLDEIQTAEINRAPTTGNSRSCFLAQTGGSLKHMRTESLDLSYKHRLTLVHFLFKREKNLTRSTINEILPESFFQSPFWTIWSAQCVFRLPSSTSPVWFLTFYQIRFPTMAQRGGI